MELGVSHVLSLSSLTPIVDNIFDKYNKKFGTHKIFFQIMTERSIGISVLTETLTVLREESNNFSLESVFEHAPKDLLFE